MKTATDLHTNILLHIAKVSGFVGGLFMIRANLYHCDAWQLIQSMPDKSVDCIITDPLYDCDLNVEELRRICRGNIIVFCAPENQFFKPDEFMFWVKTVSTKNYSKHIGRFVEMILILRGGPFNVLHWSQMTGVYDDRLIHPPVHPFEKPMSLMERLVRIYSNPGDTVFDPFMGSGSTIKASINLGRHAIGCEQNGKTFESTLQSVSQILDAGNKVCCGQGGVRRQDGIIHTPKHAAHDSHVLNKL